MTSLATDEPEFPMGQILAAYLSLTSTDQPDVAGARDIAAQLGNLTLNDREVAHRAVIDTWVAGDWHGAARRLDALLIRWPADVLGLLVGHQLDFFLGDSANLRDRRRPLAPQHRPGPPSPRLRARHVRLRPRRERALRAGRTTRIGGRGTEPGRRRATHAVVHVYEMQGPSTTASASCTGDEPIGRRATCSRSTTGGTWRSTCSRPDAPTSRCRSTTGTSTTKIRPVCPSKCSTPTRCCGAFTSTASIRAAASLRSPTRGHAHVGEPWYVFNDLHAVMALVGADRLPDARSVVDRLAAYVAAAAPSSNARMTAEVGLPASRAVVAYAEGRHADVVAGLLPVRTILARFGGSHAQRDALAADACRLRHRLRPARPRPRPARRASRRTRDQRLVVETSRPSVRVDRRRGRGRTRRTTRVEMGIEVRRRHSLSTPNRTPKKGTTMSPETTPPKRSNRKAALRAGIAVLAVSGVTAGGVSLAAASDDRHRPRTLEVDIAEDGTRFVIDEAPVFDDGFPAYGNPFITQGYIYPDGTLTDSNGVNPDGRPSSRTRSSGNGPARATSSPTVRTRPKDRGCSPPSSSPSARR